MLDAVTIVGRPSRRTGSTDSHAAAVDQTAIPRLRMLAGIYASALALMLVILELDNAGLLVLPPVAPKNPLALAAAFAASIGLIAATYSGWRARTVLAIGITYQIVGAFCITFFEQGAVAGRGVAVTCIWIMSFTLLPTRPVRAALVAFAAAAMGPLALAVQFGRGTRISLVDSADWVGFSTVGVAATIAALIARVVYGLGREIADARKLGAYILVERLGQGGMGEVWRAKHSTLVRPAAIKLIRPELTASLSPPQLEILTQRFHQEVQATAQLHSPHTVAVYDFGQTTDGTLYYVMELLDGLELETLVQRFGAQPAERVVHFLRQAAESLAEAHQRGLIHRDIKPANLYVCAIGIELDFMKVLDFGLVRHVSQDPHLTAANAIWGTPAYLAPESAALHRFDARSDIYSLGCVAYWLLTGKTVFEGETSGAMIASQIRDEPERPSVRTEIPIPRELEDIIMACLAKDPEARPQTAEQLSRLLDRIPLPVWTQRRAEAWWRANLPDVLARSHTVCRKDDAEVFVARKREIAPEAVRTKR